MGPSYARSRSESDREDKAKIARVKRKKQLNQRYLNIMDNFKKVSYDDIEDLNIFKKYVLLNVDLSEQCIYIDGYSKSGKTSVSVKPVISDILKKLVNKYKFQVPREDKKSLDQLKKEADHQATLKSDAEAPPRLLP